MKRLKIFGFHIWISRTPLKVKKRDANRDKYRFSQRKLRLALVDGKCEVCGKEIDVKCHWHRILPQGAPGRNDVDNIRALCTECWHELESKPHILGYQTLERTESFY